jgi:superfamily I DNA and/or RNA helicase
MADFFKIADFVSVTKTPILNPVEHNPNYDLQNDYKAFDQLILYAWVKKVIKFSEKVQLDIITVESMMRSSKLDFEIVYTILHDEIFPILGLDFKENRSKNGQYTPEYVRYSAKL